MRQRLIKLGKLNFYPRSPCGERRRYPAILGNAAVISIHALLAESDTTSDPEASNRTISIHALLAESDREPTALRTPHQRFLSTLSLRRATLLTLCPFLLCRFLSTLSLRRAT